MIGTKLPAPAETAILSALNEIGYSHSLIEHNVDHSIAGPPLDPVPLAAFWKMPADQHTSALAVDVYNGERSLDAKIKALGSQLWVPFGIFARPDKCDLWNILPETVSDRPSLMASEIPYAQLASTLRSYQGVLGREQVQIRKERDRQLALYESAPNDVFLQWAFQPTEKAFRRLLKNLFDELIPEESSSVERIWRLHLLIRLLGVRIAWDKGKLGAPNRNSPEAILLESQRYPSETNSYGHRELDFAQQFVDAMPPVNLRIADGGILSQVLQMHGLIKEVRDDWKLYPTPADLAWRMIQAVPMESIDDEELLVWDGTCGTGTLLVVAAEKLNQIANKHRKSDSQIQNKIYGNDMRPLLADLTRISLDAATGDFRGQQWNIANRDVLETAQDSFPVRPSVIIGNPPFEAIGKKTDYAVRVLETYLKLLKPGGVIATIMPRSILGVSGSGAHKLREQLLTNFELYEVWNIPQGYVPRVSSELAVICARKRWSDDEQRHATVWRTLDPQRKKAAMTNVVSSPSIWKKSSTNAIENPLLVDLRDLFDGNPTLSDQMHGIWISEGITPGAEGQKDVLSRVEPGAVPYLVGRTGMVPYHISEQLGPRWIRYQSPRLFRNRKASEPLFKSRKVVLTRWATGGSPWACRAAVDEDGRYPSENFIVIGPEPVISCEAIAGLFNTQLINCWITLANPSRTLRVQTYETIPLPRVFEVSSFSRVSQIVMDISHLVRIDATEISHDDHLKETIRHLTLEIDEAVYDAYSVPQQMRDRIKQFYRWYDKPRPGFDDSLVEEIDVGMPLPSEVFDDIQQSRLKFLQFLAIEKELTPSESSELNNLTSKWQEAYTAHENRIHNGDSRSWF